MGGASVSRSATRVDPDAMHAILKALTGTSPPENEQLPRFRRILVALDATRPSQNGLEWARLLARSDHADVLVAHVVEPPPRIGDEGAAWWSVQAYHDSETGDANALLDDAKRFLQAGGIRVATELREGDAASEILDIASETFPQLLIVGARGEHALERMWLGSVADRVRNLADAHILFARGAPRTGEYLAAVDETPASHYAACLAERFAREHGGHATILHVTNSHEHAGNIMPAHALSHVSLERLHGSPAETILDEAARTSCDLLLAGASGHGALKRLFMGSVSTRLAHHSPSSLLLVKPAKA